jgi:transposase
MSSSFWQSAPQTDANPPTIALFWMEFSGSLWRELSEEFGNCSSVCRQFLRWSLSGLWEQIMEALNESRIVLDALQIVNCH